MGKMPTIYGNSCYPPSSPPAPAENFFCIGTTAITEGIAIAQMVKKISGATFKFHLASEDIPGCRFVNRAIGDLLKKRGGTEVGFEIIPVSVTNVDTVARKIVDGGATAVIHYCLTAQGIAMAEALKRFGWKGNVYVTSSYVPGMVPAMHDVAMPAWRAIDWFSAPEKGVEVWRAIGAAKAKYDGKYPVVDLRWGWANGLAMTAALQKCGYPCSQDKLLSTMNSLTVGLPKDKSQLARQWRQLLGTPLRWSPTNHTSPFRGITFPRYDAKLKRVVTDKKWLAFKEVGFPS
jgi:hypothetical protein